MKCHYEILNLQRDADDSEIKTAYRKLALKWHPDKNLDNPDSAKDQFQLVQQAYEVLSDPHERAWYDNHREQILRGGHTDYEDNSLDVFQYFTASCYKGFSDDSKGFYKIYAEVFNTIATEDIEFMDSDTEYEAIPVFGDSKSSYEEVVGPFYAYWQSYCTKKSYAWLSSHNIAEIRDRRVLKVLEKESKKIQQKARKERNEAVRALVAFVRKRDKRVLAYKKLLEDKAQQNRAKHEQYRIEHILKRKHELEQEIANKSEKDSKLDDAYEEQLRQLENAYAGSSEDEYTSDDEEADVVDIENGVETINVNEEEDQSEFYNDDLYCVACNKSFRNQSSYQNHESSKKHRDNIEKLKKEMQYEENSYDKSEEDEENSELEEIRKDEIEKDEEDGIEILENVPEEDEDSDDKEKVELPQPKSTPKKSKKKNRNKKPNVYENLHPTTTDDEAEIKSHSILTKLSEDENDDWAAKSSTKKNRKTKLKQNKSKSTVKKINLSDDDDDDDDDDNDNENKKSEKKETAVKPEPKEIDSDDEIETSSRSKKNKKPSSRPSRSAQEKLKKLAKVIPKEIDENIDVNLTCVTCNEQFESKNKLFTHLKKLNHGVYIPKLGQEIEVITKKSKKKK